MSFAKAKKGTTERILAIFTDAGGSPVSGLSATVRVQRKSDSYFLQSDSTWLMTPSDDSTAVELDASNLAGVYYFDFALPDALDEYVIRFDGSASAAPRYLFGILRAVADGDGDLKLARAILGNKQGQTIATGVVTVYDDDGETPLITLTPSVDSASNPKANIITPSVS